MVEPVRSRPVSAPRLAGTPGQLIVVRLAKAGTRIKRGELLVEFDRTSQIKAARDREYEYRDILSQIERRKASSRPRAPAASRTSRSPTTRCAARSSISWGSRCCLASPPRRTG